MKRNTPFPAPRKRYRGAMGMFVERKLEEAPCSLARENRFVRSGLQLPPVDVGAELAAFNPA
jgi:hypothetical protein